MSVSTSANIPFTEWLQQVLSVYSKLDDVNKNTTLNALISSSGPNQLYELSNKVPEFVFRDFISSLPLELAINILQFLDGQELLICCQVCKSWNNTITNLSGLWCQQALDAGASISAVERKGSDVEVTNSKHKNVQLLKGHIYKQLYLKAILTLNGFSAGTCIHIQEDFIDKGLWRLTYVGYYDGCLVTGCDDHTVQIWDIPSGRTLTSVSTHSVCCLTLTSTHIYTASFNANAESWNIRTRRHSQTFCGHTSAVLAIDISPDEKFLLTGSVDKTAKLWDLRRLPAELIRTFSDVHNDWVFKVKFLQSESGHLQLLTCDSSVCSLWHMKDTGVLISSFSIMPDKPSKFTSFYHVPQDPSQMFTTQWEEDSKSSWLSKYSLHVESCTIEKEMHITIPLPAVKAYLLGAGQKFAVIMCSISRKDFHVIDIPRKVVVATIVTPDFCMLTRNGSTVTLCDTSWLNGFDFSSMKNTTPVFAASVGRNTVILGTWAELASTLNEFQQQKNHPKMRAVPQDL